jgi:transposase
MLMPVDMRDWLPPDHLAWFVVETVDALDCTLLEQTRRRGGAGTAGYDPRLLFSLLVYAYCQGVGSSREIERRCVTDVAFRVLCAQDGPDHTTIARFRALSGRAFVDLFEQVLMVAARAGLGRFGTVAIDGTKIAANASIDANRGDEWFRHCVREVVAGMVAESERADAEQDASEKTRDDELGADRVPGGLRDRTHRVERIRAAASELAAAQQRLTRADREREAAAGARLTVLRRGFRLLVVSRTDPTGWPRPRPTWPVRPPPTRPGSTVTPR